MKLLAYLVALAGVLLSLCASSTAQTNDAREVLDLNTLQDRGGKHSYYIFIPEHDLHVKPVPLIVILHGAGGNGIGQIQAWLPVARRNHVILLAPNIENSPAAWDQLYDHPEWIHSAIDDIGKTHAIDTHRVYLWGYSAGGMFTFYFAFLESRFFAAAGVYGAVIENSKYQMADFATRKIPISYYIGTRDQWWTTRQTRASRDALLSRGFQVHYAELKGADHNFYAHSSEVTTDAWDFFRQHALTDEPHFDAIDLPRIKAALK
ncbi:MAG TPA: dienelactone hydrolase family protein [Terriglobales bacterium]|nr:dienelactone hydrolase family protein [Terriglobales bacterium]